MSSKLCKLCRSIVTDVLVCMVRLQINSKLYEKRNLSSRLAVSHYFDSSNLDEAWINWEQQFRTLFTACGLTNKPKEVHVAIVLHTAGPEAQEVYNQFVFQPAEDNDDWQTVLDKCRHYCKPRENTVYEKHCLWSRNQGNGELIDQWIKDLRMKAKLCEFGDQEDLLIRDKIVFSVNDERVKLGTK